MEKFDPVSETFTRFSRDRDLRVGSLAFANDGTLWAVAWPQRTEVVRFNERARVETMLEFDTEIDSIAFGQEGTRLEGLLFISHNTGDMANTGGIEPDNSELTMVDLATLRRLAAARGGSRGDVVITTADGRVLVSQTNQVDELKPVEPPRVLSTDPDDGAIVQLPLTAIEVVFDQPMFDGDPSHPASVLNPANYAVTGSVSGAVSIADVAYDLTTFAATLAVSGLTFDDYTLNVFDTVASLQYLSLEQTFFATFTVTFTGVQPVAGADQARTNEDEPVQINVLGNDRDADGTLNPASVAVTVLPTHGTAGVDPGTGVVIYTPAENYAGADSLAYTVADNEGNISEPALVDITVIPVADEPTTMTNAAGGDQDTPIGIDITAELTDQDGSEFLMVEISNVPSGATLSTGSQVEPGMFMLTPAELTGLTIQPPSGFEQDFTLFVTSLAEERENGDRADDTIALPVTITPVPGDPVQVVGITINRGQVQRSTLHTIEVTFDNNVFLANIASAVTVTGLGGGDPALTADHYQYDDRTFTLTIDLSNVAVPDDHYHLQLDTNRIANFVSRGNRLIDNDVLPGDGILAFEFHKLLADLTGDDVIDRDDFEALSRHYRSRGGEARYNAAFDLNNDEQIDRFDYRIWRQRQGLTSDIHAPRIGAALADDTGRDRADAVTFDPTVTGGVADSSGIAELRAGLDAPTTVDITSLINSGAFTLAPADLETISGGAITDGAHALNLVAVDSRGNASDVFTLDFVLDTAAPAAPTRPDLLPDNDSGVLNSDDITAVDTPLVSTTGEPDSLVRLFIDGTEVDNEISDDPVIFRIGPVPLIDGGYQVHATAEDRAGNVSAPSALLQLTIDTTDPLVPTLALDPAFDSDPVGDGRTTEADVTLIGITDAGITVRLVENSAATTADPVTGEFSFAGVILALGNNTFTVEAEDEAGNVRKFRTVLRRIGPETDGPVVDAALANDSGRNSVDGITSDPTVAGTVNDANTVTVFQASVDGSAFGDVLGTLTGNTFTLTGADLAALNGGPLADGPHTIALAAVDEFLNAAPVFELAFTLDTAAPPAPGRSDLLPGSDRGASQEDDITNDAAPTLTVAATGNDSVRLYVDGLIVEESPVAGGTVEFTLGTDLPDGERTIAADAVDEAGNIGAMSIPLIVTVDTVGPLPGPTLDLDAASDTGIPGDDTTDLEVVALVGTTEPEASVALFRNSDPDTAIAFANADGNGDFVLPGIVLATGDNGLTVVAADLAGNESAFGKTITTTAADTLPPTVFARLLNDTGRSDTDGITRDPTLVGFVDDVNVITAFLASLDGAPFVDVLGQLTGKAFTITRADLDAMAGGNLTDGAHTLSLVATDAGDQTSPAFFVDFTLDTTRPARPATPDLLPGSDTGRSDNDNITRDDTLAIRVDGEINSRLSLFVEGIEVLSAILDGTPLDFTTAAQPEGLIRISTQVEDAAGNVSLFSNLLLVNVDTTPPAVPVFGLGESSDTRPFGDNATNLRYIRLVGRADPDAMVELMQTGAVTQVDEYGSFEFKGISLLRPGDVEFTVRATDVAGNASLGARIITRTAFVPDDLIRPEVTLSASSLFNEPGDTVTLTVTAADNVAVTDTRITIDGQARNLAADGTATFTTPEAGFFTAVATAIDAMGNKGRDSLELAFFQDPDLSGDVTPPVAAFRDPFITAIATLPGNVLGTAFDENILRYTLEISPRDQEQYAVIATGDESVLDDVLGIFDPTVLDNGFYDMRLTVVDKSGHVATATKVFKADGFAKIGVFSLSFEDLNISAAGFPIFATRTYDSRLKDLSGDFGFGWNLNVNNIKVTEANILGDVGLTQITRSPRAGIYDVVFTNTKDVTVDVTLPSGRVERFILGYVGWRTNVPNPSPMAQTELFFAPLPGTGTTSKLEALADNVVDVVPADFGSVTFRDRTTGELYDPNRWRLTTAEGVELIINQDTGIESITDLNGNVITYTEDRITHSDGRGMVIRRDDQGRVVALEDLMGQEIRYIYDFYGDLVAMTDREGHTTRFTYDDQHSLLEIHDPLGRRGMRQDYDETGRLVRLTSPEGSVVSFDRDITSRTERISDAFGNVSTMVYDERGHVVSQIDPLGHVVNRVFDSEDNLLEETVLLEDGTELTSRFTYNEAGHMLSKTNPAGETTTYERDVNGFITATVDPLGHVVGQDFDARGNVRTLTDPTGGTYDYDYNAFGVVLSVTGPQGTAVSYTYDLAGNNVAATDPAGNVWRGGYDRNGNQLTSSYTWVNPDDPGDRRDLVWEASFDANGRVVAALSPDGTQTETRYDAAGKVIEQIDELGNSTIYRYNALDQLVEEQLAEGAIRRRVYDLAGRVVFQTDLYDPTDGQPVMGAQHIYDAAGRPVQSKRLAGLQIEVVQVRTGIFESHVISTGDVIAEVVDRLDAADRLVQRQGPDGNVTLFEYDLAGRRTAIIDPLGQRHETEYDAGGRRIIERDALGRETHFAYDALGRVTQTTYAEGSTQKFVYDAAGNLTEQTDQAGRTRRFEYDTAGNVTAVILPEVVDPKSGGALVNPRYEYDYDRYGNLTGIRDPKDRETRMTYDPFNRPLTRTLPDGSVEQSFYNESGRIYRKVDYKGQVQQFDYDQFGLPVRTQLFGSLAEADAGIPQVEIVSSFDALGRLDTLLDPRRGLVDYDYDPNTGQVARVSSPEGVISYVYDPITGRLNRTFTDFTDERYIYDTIGRLHRLEVHKLNGIELTDPLVSTYYYTPTDSVERIERDNGVVSSYDYDQLERLVGNTEVDASGLLLAGYEYTLSLDGRRIQSKETIREADGTLSQRQVLWTYDAIGRLVREEVVDLSGGRPDVPYVLTYVYDIAGNRLEQEITDAAGTQTTTYAYDELNDRLLEAADSNGPVTTYEYDANGSLTETYVDGVLQVHYVYDLQNRLVEVQKFGEDDQGLPLVATRTFVYDGAGQRVRAQTVVAVDGTLISDSVQVFLLDQINFTGQVQVLEQRDAAGSPVRTFVLGLGALAQVNGDGTVLWRHTDALGSTRFVTHAGGGIVERYAYRAFGEAIGFEPETAGSALLFTGEWFDPVLDQYYLRARRYDHSLGRFTQLDPFGGNPDLPQSFHKYTYAHNNPVNLIDPTGFGISAALAGIWVHSVIGQHFLAEQSVRYPPLFVNGVLIPPAVENASINGVLAAAEAYTSSTKTGIPIWFPSVRVLVAESALFLAFSVADKLALRPDLVSLGGGGVFEIKPDNARQRLNGSRQLARYVTVLRTATAIWALKFPRLAGIPWHKGFSVEYIPPPSIKVPLIGPNIVITAKSGTDFSPDQGLVLYNAWSLIKFDLTIEYASLASTLVVFLFGGITSLGLSEALGTGPATAAASLSAKVSAAAAAIAAVSVTPTDWLFSGGQSPPIA